MSDGFYFLAGFSTSFLAVIFLSWLIIWRRMRRKRNSRCRYDERQEIVHGRGYRYAFWTLMFYDILYFIMDSCLEKKLIDGSAAIFLGVCIAITVYVSYCIWNESYFGLNNSGTRVQIYYLIMFGVIGALNLYVGIRNIIAGTWMEDGRLTFESANLFCGIMLLVIVTEILMKQMRDRKEEEEI